MIGSRHPERRSPLHSLVSGQHILKGVVEGMPEMESGRHIGRWDEYREGSRFPVAGGWDGMKTPFFAPECPDTILGVSGTVGYCEFWDGRTVL